MRILDGNAIFRFGVTQIQYQQKQPFQWLHEKIDCVRQIGRADVFGNGVARFVVQTPNCSMEMGRAFFQQLLKGVGNAQLSVDQHLVAVAFSSSQGLDYFFVAACRYGAQIMLVKPDIGRWGLLGKIPVGGLSPSADQAVRLLTEQHQNTGDDAQQWQGSNQRQYRPCGNVGKNAG